MKITNLIMLFALAFGSVQLFATSWFNTKKDEVTSWFNTKKAEMEATKPEAKTEAENEIKGTKQELEGAKQELAEATKNPVETAQASSAAMPATESETTNAIPVAPIVTA